MDKTNSSWLKTFSIGFSIISFGITLAIVGYIVLTTKQNQPANQQLTTLSPTSIQPSPTLTPSTYETASWKTYTNSQYQFSFMYPSTYKIEDWSSQRRIFTISLTAAPKQNDFVGKINPVLWVSVESTNKSLNEYINDAENNLSLIGKKTYLGNEFAIAQNTFGAASANHYLIKKGSYIFDIVNSVAFEGNIFDQILSTFQLSN